MNIFIKRFWAFDPMEWPLIAFGEEWARDALVSQSQPGDRLVVLGTLGNETSPDDRGRLLGLVDIGRIPVETGSVIDLSALEPKYFKGGKFRFPKSLPMLRAWRFPGRPLAKKVLESPPPPHAYGRAVLLSPNDQAAIEKLRREETDIADTQEMRRLRDVSESLAAKPTKGPLPHSGRFQVDRDASGPAGTYAFRFGKRNIWKIGYSQDLPRRLEEVNEHIPPVLGERWARALWQEWSSVEAAFEMEQRMLRLLSSDSIGKEMVECTRESLEGAWVKAMRD